MQKPNKIRRFWGKRRLTTGKPRAKRIEHERPLHIMIYNWLACNFDGIVYHCPNGYWGGDNPVKAVQHARKLKDLGTRAGILDLTLHWHPNKTAYFEVKSENGSLEDSQKDFMLALDKCGIPHRVLRSLRDCLTACRELNIPLKSNLLSQKNDA